MKEHPQIQQARAERNVLAKLQEFTKKFESQFPLNEWYPLDLRLLHNPSIVCPRFGVFTRFLYQQGGDTAYRMMVRHEPGILFRSNRGDYVKTIFVGMDGQQICINYAYGNERQAYEGYAHTRLHPMYHEFTPPLTLQEEQSLVSDAYTVVDMNMLQFTASSPISLLAYPQMTEVV